MKRKNQEVNQQTNHKVCVKVTAVVYFTNFKLDHVSDCLTLKSVTDLI